MAKSVQAGEEADDATTPICRCRVLYLGSAVPHITKDGLQGIQEPLRDLYPEQGVFWSAERDHAATGIDSWLSVWSNGILVENVDDKGNTVRRFHPIESLHYCAAVRYVSVPSSGPDSSKSLREDGRVAKFLPLDSPFSKSNLHDPASSGHPPLFACILRRTSGIKVLECHAFICKKEAAANALVRCCFHAYADTMHARQIEIESPYEQLDKRRSRSIGSALDSQSLIDEKINSWQKNSTGSSSGSPDETNGYTDTRSISRQKARTPSMVSLVSHQMGEMNGHPPPPIEPIYYNGIGNGTLRSVRSFMSLATLKSQKKLRPRQIPIPISAPPPPPPVMFATLSKKELKKALKKESTLKRKHKYKDFPGPFLAPGGYPIMYGPPPPQMGPAPMPIYAALPPPGPGPYYHTTLDRKGRMPPPPPPQVAALPPGPPPPPVHIDGHHLLPGPVPHPHHLEAEPLYMPALPSPSGTLRPVTPHGEPIYYEGRGGPPPPMPVHIGPPGPAPMFVPHPQTGMPVPCHLVPTLSRKELKELEKHKQAMKKAAKKEKKMMKKSGKVVAQMNGQQGPLEPEDLYQVRPPYPYPPPEMMEHAEAYLHAELNHPPRPSSNGGPNYGSTSTGGISGGIYKKKGHLNERAFSYSIRQEHRSRSNSLSNLAFENGGTPPVNGTRNEEGGSSANESETNGPTPTPKQNGGPPNGEYHPKSNGHAVNGHAGNGHAMNGHAGNGRIANGDLDPALLASRMAHLKLNGNGYAAHHQPPPPPPPLPPNGYHYQKTATIKRL